LREVLAAERAYTDITGLEAQDVLAELALYLVWGRVKVVPHAISRAPIQAGIAGQAAAPAVEEERELVAPTPNPTPPQIRVSWVKFRVIDDVTGAPIPGVTLRITLPSGRQNTYTTGADGLIAIDGIDPGTCDVSYEMRGAELRHTYAFVAMGEQSTSAVQGRGAQGEDGRGSTRSSGIVVVEKHKVQTGETLDSLAKDNGITWHELAFFNWGTSVPRQINEHLRDSVGCSKKTADGQNYLFDSEDEPGIVFIPKQWTQGGLATEMTHTVRVKQLNPFYLILENEQKLRIPEAEYEATLADGSKRKGRLGKSGVALIEDPPAGRVEAEFPDFDDVEAKSLAACARKAFDDRNPQELFRVLAHSPTMLNMVIAAYDKYYNDYTSKGLIEDLYQEFTDPVALTVVESALASAGMPTRGNVEYLTWEVDHAR
jgi:hypothetical protein